MSKPCLLEELAGIEWAWELLVTDALGVVTVEVEELMWYKTSSTLGMVALVEGRVALEAMSEEFPGRKVSRIGVSTATEGSGLDLSQAGSSAVHVERWGVRSAMSSIREALTVEETLAAVWKEERRGVKLSSVWVTKLEER
jgi:hypothetical protein